MDKTLYDLMDWAGIEEIVYSEAANPHRMLGAHMTPEGMLVQAFIPTARDITVKLRQPASSTRWRWRTRLAFLRR